MPKIAGLEARNAVLILVSVSLAAMVSEISLFYSLLALVFALVFFVPVRKGSSIGTLVARSILWKASSHRGIPPNGVKVDAVNDNHFFLKGASKGYCLEVKGADVHTLNPESRKDFEKAVSNAFSSMGRAASFLAIPFSVDSKMYHVEEADRLSENYNRFLDYLFEDQYYYRSFIIVWGNGRNSEISGRGLMDDLNTIRSALSGVAGNCELVEDGKTLSLILESLS
ncbi:hypothetical protein IX51_08310 [uncultured archaeon]|nr:hypothetical protein IX51_08310 [uncultured archaeon]HKJ96948.1 hypothetical protein [Thermoplasmataceae archaeon]